MAKRRHVRSVSELVDALGGVDAVAKRFKRRPSAIYNWSARGAVPGLYHLDILAEADRAGLSVDLVRVLGVSPAVARYLSDRVLAGKLGLEVA